MKKIFTLAVASMMLACVGAGLVPTAMADAADAPAAAVYLVPGEGNSLTGAEKADAAALHMEGDVYKAGAVGTELPTPTTTKKDADGTAFAFNGWWYIKEAEVTYTATVPEVEETTYLYADFRAPLSQPSYPVKPQGPSTEAQEYEHYLEILRFDTKKTEKYELFVSGTDVQDAETFKDHYRGPVQLYNEWFEMRPGDELRIFVSYLYSDVPMQSPQRVGSLQPKQGFQLETSAGIRTEDYILEKYTGSKQTDLKDQSAIDPAFKYVNKYSHHFRIYIKFYDDGGWMTVYMEPMDGLDLI